MDISRLKKRAADDRLAGRTAGYGELLEYMSDSTVCNTHCHYRKPDAPRTLGSIFRASYVDWLNIPFDETPASRTAFLDKVRHNTYFFWLTRALRAIYGLTGELTAESWEDWSRAVETQSPSDAELFREACGYKKIILDAYWNPGDDHGEPGLFAPTYRINKFLFGYCKGVPDHNGNGAFARDEEKPDSLRDYMAFVHRKIEEKKAAGCVALKCATAYERTIAFRKVEYEKAERAYVKAEPSAEEISDFQDFVLWSIAGIAGELSLPLQCHTGLGLIRGSNAMGLRDLIEAYPHTQFVLFHGGYPWMQDVFALKHYFSNVTLDMCWLPLISTHAAEGFLHEALEVGTLDRLCWGCDTWTPQESFGAVLAMRQVCADVFSERVARGYISLKEAKRAIDAILCKNTEELYGI